MLVVLSPAKSMDFATPAQIGTATQPQFVPQSMQLMQLLREFDVPKLAGLMHISDKLAALNVARNHEWRPVFDASNAKQAILAFNGDVYEGFDAASLSEIELLRAQNVVRSLSGLYGILRPLDLMQAYRLEMGTALANSAGKDLYAFWGDTLAQHLNAELAAHDAQILLNLASDEYFKAVPLKAMRYPVVQPMFYEVKNGVAKIVSFYAKRARGVMARFVVQHQVESVEALKAFTQDGYQFEREQTAKNGVRQLVFVRGAV
jgi:cytoplasmic iron level regulating protein YaaA (DUF328/UPF0246 family)